MPPPGINRIVPPASSEALSLMDAASNATAACAASNVAMANFIRSPNHQITRCYYSHPLFPHHVRQVLAVLLADALDEIRIGNQGPRHVHVPRLRVRLRIVDRHLDVHASNRRTMEALDHAQRFGARQPAHVEPRLSILADRLDDERVAVPLADRVALPRRLRIFRQRTAV